MSEKAADYFMLLSQRPAAKSPHQLALNELKPALHLAGCYHYRRDVWFQYRVPSHHLILIESGHIEAKTNDGGFHAGARDLVCFRPADLNQYGVHAPALYYQAHIEFAGPPRHRLTPYLDGVGLMPVRVPLGESFEEMRKFFEVLCLEVSHTGVVHELRIRAAIYEILALVAGTVGPQEEGEARIDPWLRAQQRLDSTLHGKLKIEELARQMGLSTEHFIRRFKSRFGLSPKSYHMRARLQEAARSLRAGGKSIKEVAYNLGFSDPKSFARRFKHFLGVTPSELRSSTSSDPAQTSDSQKGGFPINVHLVPPQPAQSGFDRYLPKGRHVTSSLAESDVILDKIRHPEHYV
jgi:AraC-like DNA-binding protein